MHRIYKNRTIQRFTARACFVALELRRFRCYNCHQLLLTTLTQNNFQVSQTSGRVFFAILQLANRLFHIDSGTFVEHVD